MKVISYVVDKGGGGKTYLSTITARYLSFFGRVLVIDGNSQMDTSRQFIYKKNEEGELVDTSSPENCFDNIFYGKPVTPLNVRENLDILIAPHSLRELNKILGDESENTMVLGDWLHNQNIQEYYDYVVIDTHNADDMILDNFILASDVVISPTGIDKSETFGALRTYEKIEGLKNNPELLDKDGNPYCKAKFAFVGNKLINGKNRSGTRQTKEFLERTKDNPLFIANFYYRNIVKDATSDGTTILDIASDRKYRGESFKHFFEQTQEGLEAIKNFVDVA
jgi:chromosome partitioning protein